MNLVFVDFENVPVLDLGVLGEPMFHFTLLVGARQISLKTDVVEKLMEHAGSVQLVRVATAGRNALDFILAYHIGRAVREHPTAAIHVVSKDTGFDPLIEHLCSRNIRARRHNDFKTLTVSSPSKPSAGPPVDLLSRALEHLRRNTSNRPKRRKTLASLLSAGLGQAATAAEVERVIKQLLSAGHIRVGDKENITYHLDEPTGRAT